jgi:hypothetical protein
MLRGRRGSAVRFVQRLPGCHGIAAHRPSQRHRLPERSLANLGAQPFLRDHVNAASQQGPQVHQQPTKVEQAPPRLEIDEKVDIAFSVGLAARNSPENADVARTVSLRELQDFASVSGCQLGVIHGDYICTSFPATRVTDYTTPRGRALSRVQLGMPV